MAIDGSINFDTHVDTSGLGKDISKAKSKLDRANESLEKQKALVNELKRQYDSLTKGAQYNAAVAKTTAEFEKQKGVVDGLKEKYNALASGDVAPKSLTELDRNIEKKTAEVDALFKKYEKASQKADSLDFGMDTEALRTAKAEADELNREVMAACEALDALNYKAEQIRLNPAAAPEATKLAGEIKAAEAKLEQLGKEAQDAKLNPQMSQEAQKLADKITLAEQKLDRLQGASQTANNNLQRATKQAAQTAQTAAKDSESVTDSIGKSFERFAKRIKQLFLSAFIFSVVYKGLSELKNYMSDLIQTNSQMTKSLSSIKGNLMTAFQPIYEAILPALQTLMAWLQKVTAYIASFVSALFGKTFAQSAQNAKVLNNQAKALKNTGSAAAKASKSLASFDEVNVLSNPNKDSGGGTSSGISPTFGDTSGADGAVAKIKGIFSGLVEWFNNNIKPAFEGVFGGFSRNFENLKNIFSRIFNDLKTLIEPFKKWFDTNFTVWLQTVIITCGKILNGLFDTFNLVFGDIWDKAVFPIVDNFINVVLPMLTDFSTKVWETLGVLFDEIKAIFDSVWSGAIAPLLELATNMWTDFMKTLADFWDKWGAPIFDGIQLAIQNVSATFQHVWNDVLQPVWNTVMAVIDEIWKEHLQPFFAEVMDFIGELIVGATDVYNNFIAPIVNWLVDVLGPVFERIFSSIAKVFGYVIGVIVDGAKMVINWFKHLIQFITGVFSGNWDKAWNAMKDGIKDVWNGIWGVIKNTINFIIDGINSLWQGVYIVIKGIVDSLGKVAGAVGKLFGQDWSFSMPDKPSLIPKLATGTVVPANYGEFLAVLGDNKREAEIVSPISAMKQAFKEAITEMGGGMNSNGDTTVILEIDGTEFARAVYKANNSEKQRIGTRLAGAY